MRIGILGATGPAGGALAARLASVGFEVVMGSRSEERAAQAVAAITERWPRRTLPLTPADNHGAASQDVVVVATPWDAAAPVALSVRDELDGKVVICIANALTRVAGYFEPLVPPRGSVSASVQAAVPSCRVAAAFHHVPAKELANLRHPIESDVLICSDHPDATEITAKIVDLVPDMRPLDAGQLSMATPIESFTAVLLQLNQRYKTRVSLKLVGISV
ncbi:MAG: NADPH-dependent F420 reductase [Acidimicrobiales bacterium]